ncbi:peptidase M41 [Pseudomonas putida]|uniref:peptidase M41 n=1 Tax=Pseudomonas putida TaxID=303 RepID=UPI00236397F8|nr:peptidase M41 [Pseudomonas putida]MDD2139791.1 peptidase M41 [Pseudomonas putida]HDS1721715.1 peptidase M41 [Pseudomonas putida]
MIPDHHRTRARPIAQHEMGHYVIAKALGFCTGEVSLTLIGFDGHRGEATLYLYEPFETVPQIRSYLEKRILVLFAGSIAETLPPIQIPTRGVDQEKAQTIMLGPTAENDYGKARELVAMLRNILHPDTSDLSDSSDQKMQIINRLWDRAVELVEQHDELIVGLASSLVASMKPAQERETYKGTLSEELLAGLPSLQDLQVIDPFPTGL